MRAKGNFKSATKGEAFDRGDNWLFACLDTVDQRVQARFDRGAAKFSDIRPAGKRPRVAGNNDGLAAIIAHGILNMFPDALTNNA